MTIIVTGGAGFIGSNFIIDWFFQKNELVVNLDKLTYSGNLENLKSLNKNDHYRFVHGDICNTELVQSLFEQYKPCAIINFAAESHVDRSILDPEAFIQTNIVGTFRLLETARIFWNNLNPKEKLDFRFLHVSTDEVYGTLKSEDLPFSENNRYLPNSPYSASKAASDHLVRSYFHTYNLPVLTTNCSNNYGPYQFPEKLIPLVINNALNGFDIPIYGDGQQTRDWLYVSDHCSAIRKVLEAGRIGEVYNIGGLNEKANIDIVYKICELLDEMSPKKNGESYKNQITFVKDRPGHDRRYAIDASKIENELAWRPAETFETGIRKTVHWYLANSEWIQYVTSGAYQSWIDKQYAA